MSYNEKLITILTKEIENEKKFTVVGYAWLFFVFMYDVVQVFSKKAI